MERPIIAGCCALLTIVAACGHKKMSGDEQARLTAQLAADDATTAKLDGARRDALVAASGDALPSAPRQCPPDIGLVDSDGVENFVRLVKRGVPAPKMSEVHALEESPGLRTLVYQHDSSWPRSAVREPQEAFDRLTKELDRLAKPAFWSPYEISFVVEQVDPPHVGLGGFSGGTLSGRVLVWSYDRGQLACWAPVQAALHDKEEIAPTKGDYGDDSLLFNLYAYADQAALKAIGLDKEPGQLAQRGY